LIGRYIPDWLRRAPEPGARSFAILAGLDASVRAMLTSVWPLAMYQSLGDAQTVSGVYFAGGLASLIWGLLVPWAGRRIPRRWLYGGGAGCYILGPALALTGGPLLTPLGMVVTWFGTVTCFVAVSAYLMDFIARHDLGRTETLKLFYSAVPWTVGPVLGVTLWKLWTPLPFLVAMTTAAVMFTTFRAMRMGDGRAITRARAPTPNPLAFLGRFAAQPRLIAGWMFAVVRSVGWWVYVVYLPIFCIESGLGDRVASYAYSASNGMLLLAPLIQRWMAGRSLRHGVRTAFAGGTACFLVAGLAGFWPPLAVIAMLAGSFFLVMLDVFGGLPFLTAVRPAERTEMSAVYASFRDVSSIVTPGMAWLVLLVAPVPMIFAAAGAIMAGTFVVAGRMHPRQGRRRAVAASDKPV
jgi:hypothetical protein